MIDRERERERERELFNETVKYIITKTNKTLVLLNFNDPNNPYKDECGNIWNVYGNPHLIYDNTINSYVLSFNKDTQDYLQLNKSLKFESKSYTIDGILSIGYMDNIKNNKFFVLKYKNDPFNWERMGLGIHNEEYKPYFVKDCWEDYTIPYSYKNTYFHFAIVFYNYQTNFYINGIKYFTYPGTIGSYNYTWEIIKLCAPSNMQKPPNNNSTADEFTDFITCKFKYFRIEQDILFDNDFNNIYTKLPFDNIKNIKKLFSFKYNLNTSRETKWNQKVNMYVIDPNHYASQAKSIQE